MLLPQWPGKLGGRGGNPSFIFLLLVALKICLRAADRIPVTQTSSWELKKRREEASSSTPPPPPACVSIHFRTPHAGGLPEAGILACPPRIHLIIFLRGLGGGVLWFCAVYQPTVRARTRLQSLFSPFVQFGRRWDRVICPHLCVGPVGGCLNGPAFVPSNCWEGKVENPPVFTQSAVCAAAVAASASAPASKEIWNRVFIRLTFSNPPQMSSRGGQIHK